MTDEFGRVCQGLGPNSDGSETLFFIPKHSIPKGRTVTYARVVCADSYASPVAGTESNSQATSAPKQWYRQRLKQKRSKAIDMRFYWVRDRVRQKQFQIFWQKGSLSRADYFTKHHPASHHQTIRPFYLHTDASHNDNYYQCLLDDTTDDTPMPPSIAATNNFESYSCAVTAAGEGVLIPGSLFVKFSVNQDMNHHTAESHLREIKAASLDRLLQLQVVAPSVGKILEYDRIHNGFFTTNNNNNNQNRDDEVAMKQQQELYNHMRCAHDPPVQTTMGV
jgi:hypothetical protein